MAIGIPTVKEPPGVSSDGKHGMPIGHWCTVLCDNMLRHWWSHMSTGQRQELAWWWVELAVGLQAVWQIFNSRVSCSLYCSASLGCFSSSAFHFLIELSLLCGVSLLNARELFISVSTHALTQCCFTIPLSTTIRAGGATSGCGSTHDVPRFWSLRGSGEYNAILDWAQALSVEK